MHKVYLHCLKSCKERGSSWPKQTKSMLYETRMKFVPGRELLEENGLPGKGKDIFCSVT